MKRDCCRTRLWPLVGILSTLAPIRGFHLATNWKRLALVLESNSNPPDNFLNRFAELKTQAQPIPRALVNEEPGQPLARLEFKTAKSHAPIIASLQPDQFGRDWKRDLDGQSTTTATTPRTVQGNSRTTWGGLTQDETRVQLKSEGRPISANVQVWSGPNNVPSKMKIYSEDGAQRPWNAAFATPTVGGGPPALDVQNQGPLEYPLQVQVAGTDRDDVSRTTEAASLETQTIHGDSLGYFSCRSDTQQIRVEIFSEGMPVYANIELWQGPGTVKQVAEIYSDHGLTRPWSAVIETLGYPCTLAVYNVGPMEYPLQARVERLS